MEEGREMLARRRETSREGRLVPHQLNLYLGIQLKKDQTSPGDLAFTDLASTTMFLHCRLLGW